MLICQKDGWRIEADGYVSAVELRALNGLREVETARAHEAKAETARLADRARAIKRRAWCRGFDAGRRAALHKYIEQSSAVAFASRCLQQRLADLVMNAIVAMLGELPPGVVLMTRLRSCIDASRAQQMLSVRVSACDFEEAQRVVRTLEKEFNAPVLTVLSDAELPPRSLILETGQGVIDGSLTAQLRTLERGMKDAINNVLDEYRYIDDESARLFAAVDKDLRETIDALGTREPQPGGEKR